MEISPFLCHFESISSHFNPLTEDLEPIIYTITRAMDTEKIFLLNTYPANPEVLGKEYDLLVLTGEKGKRPMHEFESLVDNRCHDFAPLTISIHKWATVNQLLANGNIFFSKMCTAEKLIYDSGKGVLTTPVFINPAPSGYVLKEEFRQQMAKAKNFLLGAITYKMTREFQLGTFMLHQAVEQTLNAFLLPLMGFRLQTHNLQKLLLYVRRLSTTLYYDVFPRNTDKEIQLFQLLQKAYIYGRYKNNFQVSEETMQILIDRIISLQEITSCVFREKFAVLFE
jgi:HEPN domain-containing protein